MYIYIYIYIHRHIHIHMPIQSHTHTHTHTHTHRHRHRHVHVHIRVHREREREFIGVHWSSCSHQNIFKPPFRSRIFQMFLWTWQVSPFHPKNHPCHAVQENLSGVRFIPSPQAILEYWSGAAKFHHCLHWWIWVCPDRHCGTPWKHAACLTLMSKSSTITW